MDKNIIIAIITMCALCAGSFFLGRTYHGDRERIAEYQRRERDFAERLAEYQQREAARIADERERVRRTEEAISGIQRLDKGTSALLTELKQEVDILANYFYDSRNQLGYYSYNMEGE